jgi:hypothetical protein
MSQRVLLGWELGFGLNYAHALAALSGRLVGRGVTCAVAARDVARVAPLLPAGVRLLQAPVWPGQHVDRGEALAGARASLGDMLAALGLTTPGALGALLDAWAGIIDGFGPALVVADYAPGLLLAARGRLPSAIIGFGNVVPPSSMTAFPGRHENDEAALVFLVNAVLRARGRPELARLPEIFAAEAAFAGDHPFFDPFAAARGAPLFKPLLEPVALRPARPRQRLFVYLHANLPGEAQVVAALAALPCPRTVFMPGLNPAYAGLLSKGGADVVADPIPFGRIADDGLAILHAAGHGLSCEALAAGVPQLLLPDHAEQRANAAALERLGVGMVLERKALTPPVLRQAVEALAAGALEAGARREAERQAADPRPAMVDAAAGWIAARLG